MTGTLYKDDEDPTDKAIAETRRTGSAFVKFLSANDAGLTGGHQAGILVGRRAWPLLFDDIDDIGSIAKREVTIRWPENVETTSTFTWYPSKKELRITRFGRGFPFLTPEQAGALFVMARTGKDDYRAFILDGDDAADRYLETFQLSPADLNQIVLAQGQTHSLEQDEADAIGCWVDELRLGEGNPFPDSETVSRKAREIQEAVHNHSEQLTRDPDRKLVEFIRVEYALFRYMEQAKYLFSIQGGFDDLDSFLKIALSLLNSRKSRAGRSFENQIGAILRANDLQFEEQVITEGRKKPDFIFPSGAAYHDPARKPETMIVLAAKTTCKDRWRQILSEAGRMKDQPKWLITLQPSNSKQQLEEMKADNVRLIVPKTYIASYPKEYRSDIWTVKRFIEYVKDNAQD
ncbi:type II restriction endonuclease [Bifidobacterium italicum]|nr:type II restriction endonuclease [Bifidobacterium italicum]